MLPKLGIPLLAALTALAANPARAQSAPVSAAPVAAEASASPDAGKVPSAALAEGETRLEYASGCGACRTYREHAPLAWFSLGSLAVGGVFYGIQSSVERDGPGAPSGNGSRMEIAVGAAGLTALAAGAAYLYYALRGEEDAEARAAGAESLPRPGTAGPAAALAAPGAGFRAGADPAGGAAAAYAVSVSFPLSAFGD